MQVIVITGFYPAEQMGGAEYQTLLLAQGLVARGHDVIFLATNTRESGRFEQRGITVLKLPGWRSVGWQVHRKQIRQILQAYLPDICYVRSFEELAAVAPACQKMDVPVVSVSCHAMETSPLLLGHHPRETI